MEKLEVRLQKRMHVSLYALLFLTVLLGISILLEGCSDSCETKVHYTYFEPVYKSHEELRSEITLTSPAPIGNVGKIYRKDNLLLVNDPGNGIHIIDNSNPANPQKKSFLKVPGNFEMAIKGNYLYADNYTDLVIFDLSNLASVREIKRVENVFENNYSWGFAENTNQIVTAWEEKERIEVQDSDCGNAENDLQVIHLSEGIAVFSDAGINLNKSTAMAPGNGSGPGVGGSMARFTIAKDRLFLLNTSHLQSFNITNAINPIEESKNHVGWDIETIFPFKENIFIGSSSGMHIYDISNPESPSKLGMLHHFTSCDPVVADDKHAFVTLRGGTECRGFTNQLDVIDIENLSSPALLKTYAMTNPFGLGKDGNTLFICDGSDGLKVFDAADVTTITSNLLAHYKDIDAYDVIPWNDVLVMIGQDGLFQYDYTNPRDIKLLSHLPITNGN